MESSAGLKRDDVNNEVGHVRGTRSRADDHHAPNPQPKEVAPGFEPGGLGLEMPAGILAPTTVSIKLRCALAVVLLLCMTGNLDTSTASVLWQVVLP